MPSSITLNHEIAELFRAKARQLHTRQSGKPGERYFFRARAYEVAADAIESLDESLADMYRRSWIVGMQKIDGIGNRIARDIERELNRRGIRKA